MRTNEALRALLSLIRREAPHLSGKVLGDAEAALASAPPAAEPVGLETLPNGPSPFDASKGAPKNPTADEALTALGWLYWHQRSDGYTEYTAVMNFINNVRLSSSAAPQPAEPAQPATQAGAGELPDQMDAIALARFKVQPTTSGYWGWCVKAGDGDAELYKGHKSDCELVARRMLGAFLDGGHKALELLAAQPTEQPSQDAERLDWLEAQGGQGLRWIARTSVTGRGYRLHQDPSKAGKATAREAIDAARAHGEKGSA